MSIKLMDSSVRDGGNVNDWNFGKRTLHGIIDSLVNAGVDVVELGCMVGLASHTFLSNGFISWFLLNIFSTSRTVQ